MALNDVFDVAGLGTIQRILKSDRDVQIGTSSLTLPRLYGIGGLAVYCGYAYGGVNIPGGLPFWILGLPNNSYGASLTIRGFGFGTSTPDVSFTGVPDISASVSSGSAFRYRRRGPTCRRRR